MKNRPTKWTATLSAVSILWGSLVLISNSATGATRLVVGTRGPNLVSIRAQSADTADFCFDEEVTEVDGDAGDFQLFGYDSNYVALNEQDHVKEDFEDGRCVEVRFEGGSAAFDIRELTLGNVDGGAVANRRGDSNPDGTTSLTGSTAQGGPGRTTAPNLSGFELGNDSITFTFDQNVECEDLNGSADAENFGFYDDDNDVIRVGDSLEECVGPRVVVGFAPESPADGADRVFVANGGNADLAADPAFEGYATAPSGEVCAPDYGTTGTGACSGFESIGSGIEDRPDLTGAERSGGDRLLYLFDRVIDPGPINDGYFHLYEEDGTVHTPASGACTEQNDSGSECAFADITKAGALGPGNTDLAGAGDGEFPLAAVEHCAVKDAGGACSTIGSTGWSSSGILPGYTDGPDLEVVNLQPSAGIARFCFDEPVSDDEADDVSEDDFFLLDRTGDPTGSAATAVAAVAGSCVDVAFDREVLNAAVAGGVDEDAVEDGLENGSPPGVVGAIRGSPMATTTQTSTGTVETTSSPTRGSTSFTDIGERRVATVLTIRYDADANVFRGAAATRVRRCRSGRLVTLKEARPGRDRIVRTDTTNRRGRWKIRKRARAGRFYAVVARKIFTSRTRRTTCLRDRSVTIDF